MRFASLLKRLRTEPLKLETRLRVVCSREDTRKCKQQVAERSRLRWSDCESEAVDRPVTGAGATSYAFFMYLASCSKFATPTEILSQTLRWYLEEIKQGSAQLFFSCRNLVEVCATRVEQLPRFFGACLCDTSFAESRCRFLRLASSAC